MTTLKYTVKLINAAGIEVKSAPASTKQNARGWATVARREAGKGCRIEIKENATGWVAR